MQTKVCFLEQITGDETITISTSLPKSDAKSVPYIVYGLHNYQLLIVIYDRTYGNRRIKVEKHVT